MPPLGSLLSGLARWWALAISALLLTAMPVSAQVDAGTDAGAKKAEWWSSVEACSKTNRAACDKAVRLAAGLFERTDRNVAVTWMQVCMADDYDRCEIGYRRFKGTTFDEDPQPISDMFARAACFGGLYDLCRPWGDFDTTDEDKRAVVAAEVCMEGGLAGTCYRALAHFRDQEGLYNTVTFDLSKVLCRRYLSGSACRVFAQALEARWDYRGAYNFHKLSCEKGLSESCPDSRRLKKRVDYLNRKSQEAFEAKMAREAASQRAATARTQLRSSGYTSPGYVRTPLTPFGSSTRAVRNWNRYNENLRCGNPTASGC